LNEALCILFLLIVISSVNGARNFTHEQISEEEFKKIRIEDYPGVHGWGVGFVDHLDDESKIICYVLKKLPLESIPPPQRIPKYFNSCKTAVFEKPMMQVRFHDSSRTENSLKVLLRSWSLLLLL
jgi:hypothetical protein